MNTELLSANHISPYPLDLIKKVPSMKTELLSANHISPYPLDLIKKVPSMKTGLLSLLGWKTGFTSTRLSAGFLPYPLDLIKKKSHQ
jgi:ribosomal protein L13E